MKKQIQLLPILTLLVFIVGCGHAQETPSKKEVVQVPTEKKEVLVEEDNRVIIEPEAIIEPGVIIENNNTVPQETKATPQKTTKQPVKTTPDTVQKKPENMSQSTLPITNHTITWKGRKKVGSEHYGTIALKNGSLIFENDTLVGGNFTINMGSISVQDLTGGGKSSLENHLNSADFFATAAHPEAQLVITNAEKKAEDSYNITANLTLKDITHPITFTAIIKGANKRYTAEANFSIDRSRWNVRFGSGKFFSNLGNNLIEDQIPLSVSLST